MASTPYERGRNFEYRTKKHLEALGYLVARSPASKSPFDLIAIVGSYDDQPLPVVKLVQCKLDGRFSKRERNELSKLADSYGLEAWLARPGAKRRGVELIQVTE